METAFTLSLAEWLAILQSRRHGELRWDYPPKLKHYESVDFCLFLNLKSPYWKISGDGSVILTCMGVRRGAKKGICPPLENGTKKQIFLENVKSAFLILMSWVNSCNSSLFADMTQTLTLQKSQVHCSRRLTAGPAPASKSAKLSSTTRPFAQWNLILTHLQPSKILEKRENKEKLFELNMYFVSIFIRFCAYSNNLQSL